MRDAAATDLEANTEDLDDDFDALTAEAEEVLEVRTEANEAECWIPYSGLL